MLVSRRYATPHTSCWVGGASRSGLRNLSIKRPILYGISYKSVDQACAIATNDLLCCSQNDGLLFRYDDGMFMLRCIAVVGQT